MGIDKNHDGAITREEFQKFMQEINVSPDKQERNGGYVFGGYDPRYNDLQYGSSPHSIDAIDGRLGGPTVPISRLWQDTNAQTRMPSKSPLVVQDSVAYKEPTSGE